MATLRRVSAAARRRWCALALVGAALCALVLRVPAHLDSALHFPKRSPADLAHALADFSNQPDIDSWWVEEDLSNYTTWRYAVRFSCGARCSGRAAVSAHDEPHAQPRHGHAARRHRVQVARRSCTRLPLLPWPHFCEELEMDAVVSGPAGAEGGAQLRSAWRTRCGALAWLSGACATGLRAHVDRRHHQLYNVKL